MNINKIIEFVESSPDFKKLGGDYKLVHFFRMMDSQNSEDCQIGYYSKKSDKIVVFEYDTGVVKALPPEEAFKEKGDIAPLELKKLMISLDDALNKAQEVVKNNYPAHLLSKAIVLLQKLPEYGQLWNITVITHTFQVINIKINAETGDVIKHSMESLLGWKKDE
ncbi:MAG: hypothetical protein ACP5NV_02380 [Candidatus Woesearchaeota archaeon]